MVLAGRKQDRSEKTARETEDADNQRVKSHGQGKRSRRDERHDRKCADDAKEREVVVRPAEQT